jgi:hypothetical protein
MKQKKTVVAYSSTACILKTALFVIVIYRYLPCSAQIDWYPATSERWLNNTPVDIVFTGEARTKLTSFQMLQDLIPSFFSLAGRKTMGICLEKIRAMFF